MKMYDILVSVNGSLEWVTDIYRDDLNDAITDAIQLIGKAEYIGHKAYKLQNGAWAEVELFVRYLFPFAVAELRSTRNRYKE